MIRFVDVHKSYRVDGRDIPALQPFSLDIADGEVFGIIGLSGAGKSTLIRLVNLLERPSGGTIFVGDTEMTALAEPALRAQRRRIGMIFQHFNLLASQTVADNVAFPMRLAGEHSASVLRARVDELLARVGLSAHADKYPSQLSGGQKQRVGIARALANRPSILLCDEATSALDPQTTASVLELLAEINRELELTIVLITHEMDVVRRVCDRVAVLDAGVIVERGAVADVFLHPQHDTTRRFVNEALPEEAASDLAPFAQVPGRILRLSFRGDTTLTPALGRVARDTGIDFNILAGRIDRIKNLPYGQLTLAVQGERVDVAMAALREAGIEIEELPR
ncbi:methionine ABC transporter ATP-binding protein [Rhodanobacter glycinis]|uniref:Cell division ATP-binding protein FtsE n=1 Tax=Rhodanobacter glycinis TaxID=582702 RepID=A0A502C050_9GAMM|nr:methionine ABC transporter ATP-binding protein [Rhodanobacter glycinis]TPG05499.1 methionine ABC transporter ATP-binding protein [Rhodanobacter glycinis]